MVVTKVGFLNSDWSVLHHHSDWSIRKPSKVKCSGKKERAHDGLMATIWTWSLLMTSSDNSKSPSARLENLLEKTFVENFRKWAAEIWFNLIAVPLNKINQKLNQHIPAACSFFSSCKQLISEQYFIKRIVKWNCEIVVYKRFWWSKIVVKEQAAGWPSRYIKILKSTVLSKSGVKVKMRFLRFGRFLIFKMIRTLRHPLPLSSP